MSEVVHLIGVTLAGKYQLRRVLGQGGMGAVFEGVHLEIGKRVAIKVINLQFAHMAEFAARFKREARATSAIESEHIVQVFDVGHDPQVGLYMVMEYLSGEDLATRLERDKRFDPSTAVAIFGQVLRGLAKAHAAGVIHRDLKPANIFLVARDGGVPLVKILDFGISKFLRDEEASSERAAAPLTRAGAVIGTVLYMSPEQAQGSTSIDHRTDVWSIGAVLYQALSGRTPFDEATSYEAMLFRIVTTPPAQLISVAPHLPPALVTVVHQSLVHDPSKRIPDCATFCRMLESAVPMASGDWLGRPSHPNPSSPSLGPTDPFGYGGATPPGMYGPIGAEGITPPQMAPAAALPPTKYASPTGPGTAPGTAPGPLRTTGAAVMTAGEDEQPAGVRRMGTGKALGILFAVAVPLSIVIVLVAMKRGGLFDVSGAQTSPSASVVGASSTPSATPAPSHEANRWVHIQPPKAGSSIILGVPADAPPDARGFRPARRIVAPTIGFDIQQHEVTWGELEPWLEKNGPQDLHPPADVPTGTSRLLLPATGVPWEIAHNYCRAIGGNLPREEEWEYAARGQSLRRYAWGDGAPDLLQTNIYGGKQPRLKPVMTSDQDETPGDDPETLFDMMGNAREWTADLYREDSPKSPQDEAWVQEGGMTWRAVRGMPLDDVTPKVIPRWGAAHRNEVCASGPCPKGTDVRLRFIGFRCTRHAKAGDKGSPRP